MLDIILQLNISYHFLRLIIVIYHRSRISKTFLILNIRFCFYFNRTLVNIWFFYTNIYFWFYYILSLKWILIWNNKMRNRLTSLFLFMMFRRWSNCINILSHLYFLNALLDFFIEHLFLYMNFYRLIFRIYFLWTVFFPWLFNTLINRRHTIIFKLRIFTFK